VAHPVLNPSRIVAGIPQGIAAGMGQHVGVRRAGESRALADALDRPVHRVGRERTAALGSLGEGLVPPALAK
jgi:hypothetical protein